jgi:hypothetical protein
MTDWRVKQIKLRLEYAVKPPDDDTQPPRIEFDPYEDHREIPVASEDLFTTDQPDNVPGKVILCLEEQNNAGRFALHRLKDEVGFDFDTDRDLTLLQGALKVNFTFTDQATGAEIADTSFYPISSLHDFPITEADMPPSNECALLLKQDDQDPSVHRLVYVEPTGPGAVPICQRLKCKTTTDPSRRRRCARHSCYK